VASALGLDGYYYTTETPPVIPLLVLLAAPLLLYVSLLPKIRAMKPRNRFIVQMILVAIPFAIAFGFALAESPIGTGDPYSGY
jgi:hypothetical protein